MSRATTRDPSLDALRGAAIGLVVLQHVAIRVPLTGSSLAGWLPARLLDALTSMGYEAVFVFFALSGFLVASRTWARAAEAPALTRPSVVEFYVRRAARIAPALLALVASLCALNAAGLAHYVVQGGDRSIGGAALSSLGLRLNVYEGRHGLLPASWDVLWSLSIEELFYLGFPLMCLALGRSRAFVPVLVILALSLPWTRAALHGQGIWQQKADLPGLSAIAMGVLAAWAVRRRPVVPPWAHRAARIAGLAGMASVWIGEDLVWKLVHQGSLAVLAGSAALYCAGCAWRGELVRPGPFFAPLRVLGRLSYEIYLTHMFVVWAVADAFVAAGSPASWAPAAFAAAMLAAAGLGVFIARGFTQPAERWLLGGWRARRAARVAMAEPGLRPGT